MSATVDDVSGEHRQPWVVCAAVATTIVVGCLLFNHYWELHGYPALARHLMDTSQHVTAFIAIMTPYAVLTVALAIWGLDARHRIAGSACAIAAGLTAWGAQELFQHWIDNRAMPGQATLRAIDWTLTLVLPTLLTLAWGFARRHGSMWLIGVVVAPGLAAIQHELFLHSTSWQSWVMDHNEWWQRQLYFIVPVVVAAIACWLIEATTRVTSVRSPLEPPPVRAPSAR